jgi:glycosyltransferase involved in cell wall biosynthesis
VIDDCSPDETADRAEFAGAIVFRNDRNLGYEGNLSRGFNEAAALGFTHVVTMDADGEHDAELLAKYRRLLLEDHVPLVLGVRPRMQRVSEVIMGWYVRFRFGARDILCGMKGYDLDLWRANGGFDSGGSIGTELAINSLRRGVIFREVAVHGTARRDAPRFDRHFRANLRILGALAQVVLRDLHPRVPVRP